MQHQVNRVLMLGLLLLLIVSQRAFSHAPNQTYIYIRIYDESMEGRLEITTRDLNKALNLNLEKTIIPEVFEPYTEDLKAYVLQNLSFASSQGGHPIRFKEIEFVDRGYLGTYILLKFDLENIQEIPDEINVKYSAIFNKFPEHRGFLMIEHHWKAGILNNEGGISLIFGPGNEAQSLSLEKSTVFNGFLAMIKFGTWHILIGLDHILFLFSLILPSVLVLLSLGKQTPQDTSSYFKALLSADYWQAVERFKPALIFIIKIVTFFTIAHSITLSLAALEIVVLPSRLVESVIAISIALAAFHNIRPIVRGKDWLIAFIFGLFHGFGFASVLSEGGLSGEYMLLSLLGFNLGVELGQLGIICIIFPVLFLLRKTKFYAYLLNYGSVLLIIISMYWFIERAFVVDIPVRWILDMFLNLF